MLTSIYSWLPHAIVHHSKKRENSPFQSIQQLNDLANTMKSMNLDEWSRYSGEIKEIIQQHSKDLTGMDQFLKTISEYSINLDPEKMISILSSIITLGQLKQVISYREKDSEIPFKDVFDWAAMHAPLFSQISISNPSTTKSLYNQWKKYRLITFSLIPNIINVFLRGLSFLDERTNYGVTLFETSLAIGIAYKFLSIPYYLIQYLEPVTKSSAKTYLIAGLIIGTLGCLLGIYRCFLKPVPSEIVNCTNLDRHFEMGLIEPKVGQGKEIERLITSLSMDANVMLVGKAGDGKTALIQHFIQLKHERKLPLELQRLRAFEIDCAGMMSNVSYGHGELFNLLKKRIEGCEEDVLLILDEFHPIMLNEGAFQAFKKRLLQDKPRSKIVVILTDKQFKEVSQLDRDGSFMRRMNPIFMDSSEELIRLILQEKIQRMGYDHLITDDAIDAILECSKTTKDDKSPGRPSQAIKLLIDAIGVCKQAYNPYSISPKLSQAHENYQRLKFQAEREIIVTKKTWDAIKECQSTILRLEQEHRDNHAVIRKIKNIGDRQQHFKCEYFRLTHLFAKTVDKNCEDMEANRVQKVDSKKKLSVSQQSINEKDQWIYLWYAFYAFEATKSQLESEMTKMGHIPIRVDAQLVRRLHEESLEIEKRLNRPAELGDEKNEKGNLTGQSRDS